METDAASRHRDDRAAQSALARLISERYFLAGVVATECTPAIVSVPA